MHAKNNIKLHVISCGQITIIDFCFFMLILHVGLRFFQAETYAIICCVHKLKYGKTIKPHSCRLSLLDYVHSKIL